ncbi:sensor histidine kinase [Daejeonella oryzae]|uniref:sensor histidine kinase n=1 Tax=Daejeonella oryzae TaxID=1122943 RepID=UPI0012DD88FE|nr:HAMP domain-containing sensor histidine kinase [Daejeonella oryzae]
MEQIEEFFRLLLNTKDFPARWHCGRWTDFHGWVYVISDLFIWGAYFAIPILLLRLITKRTDIPFPKVFRLFIAFIMLCGLSHLIDAVIFWWPAYRLSALIRLLTAIVSVFTIYALYKILPMAYTLRTAKQLEYEINERKKAEREAQEQQIAQLATADLMRKKDEFMSIASHELKTPITSVKGALQIIERYFDEQEQDYPVSVFVKKASRQVNKLTSLVEDLLDVTKIQSGKLEINKQEFAINELLNECTSMVEHDLKNHKITINGNVNLLIKADKNRLEQVVSNLITNAIKYSPNGGIIEISVSEIKGYTKIEIRDNGIGIEADKIPYIFDRFFRVENSSQNYSGLGLGLFISSQIIERHDGEMGVESQLNQGSVFWFTLPKNG